MEQRTTDIFKVFIGSPGDVAELRTAAFDLIKRLSQDEWCPEGLQVEGYGWDVTHYPKLVQSPPQANIQAGLPSMAEYDLCVFIIGTRLGTPLDTENFEALPDGRQPTGTEYEFNQTIAQGGRPAVLIYYQELPPTIDPAASPEEQQASFEQFQRAQAFINSISQNKSGHYVGDLFRFKQTDEFKEQLEKDLKKLVNELKPAAEAGRSDFIPVAVNVPEVYLSWLQRELPDPNLRGIGPKASNRIRLPDIYVPALVRARKEHPAKAAEHLDQEHSELQLLLTRLDQESLYVSGSAGAGKSTFSFWLCWLISKGQLLPNEIEAAEEYQETLPRDLMGRLPLL